MPDDEICLVAYLKAKPGKEAALAEAVAAIVPRVRAETGCIGYTAHVSREEPGTIVMYEVWADQGALDTHAKAPALSSLAARFDELLAEPLGLTPLRRIA